MRIAVVGAGAMGSVYAGLLGDSGNEVWAVDPWVEHVDAIRGHGVRVETAGGERVVRIRATTDPGDVGIVDLVVIATKAMDVRAAAEGARALRRAGDRRAVDPERPRLGRRGGGGPRRRPRPARHRGRLRLQRGGARARSPTAARGHRPRRAGGHGDRAGGAGRGGVARRGVHRARVRGCRAARLGEARLQRRLQRPVHRARQDDRRGPRRSARLVGLRRLRAGGL